MRGPSLLLSAALGLAPAPASAQAPRAEGPAPGAQLARSGLRTRPPVDPYTRELREARGILAGGIILTTVCAAGFGAFTYVVIHGGSRLSGPSGGRVLAAGGAMLACTLASVAGIAVGAHRLRRLRGGHVAWTGGLGFRF